MREWVRLDSDLKEDDSPPALLDRPLGLESRSPKPLRAAYTAASTALSEWGAPFPPPRHCTPFPFGLHRAESGRKLPPGLENEEPEDLSQRDG